MSEKLGSFLVRGVPQEVLFRVEEKKAQLKCKTWLELLTKIANAELKNGKLIVEVGN